MYNGVKIWPKNEAWLRAVFTKDRTITIPLKESHTPWLGNKYRCFFVEFFQTENHSSSTTYFHKRILGINSCLNIFHPN